MKPTFDTWRCTSTRSAGPSAACGAAPGLSAGHAAHTARRGSVLSESLLLMVVLIFFLMLSPAIMRLWLGQARARIDVQRDAMSGAVTWVDGALVTAPTLGDDVQTLPPTIIPAPDLGASGDLARYRNLPTRAVHSVVSRRISATTGYWFDVTVPLLEQATVPRTPWTWESYPYVSTQDQFESNRVQGWWEAVRDQTLDAATRDALGLVE